jgi:diguanylate cyclase (GGDEF)-like protein
MFLDLDRFKSINDSLGHAIGNQLLQAVSKRLCETVREVDTVARMGGDEFTVLLHGVSDRDDAAIVADKIIEQFAIPFQAGGRELHTSTSIGIALFPSDGDDVDSLLKHADSAMYRAKAKGRDTYEFFTRDMSVQAQARLSVESALRHALDRRNLELHYQPQIDVATGRVVGLEALARWPHKEFGTVMPDVFVPVAEETGLIAPLGDWAIDQALADLHLWRNAGLRPRPVSVNLSARQLSDSGLPERIADALQRHDVPAGLLVLEITESVFMRNLPRATVTLRELRAIGVGCAIDDFGTGFSGLCYLADMPIDTLKIDRSFVNPIERSNDNAPIVQAIIGLAQGLQLSVIAEGVETVEQLEFLSQHGCTNMQGYYFSRPLAFSEIANLLERDDEGEIGWLAPKAEPSIVTSSNEPSSVLAALCGGVAVDIEHEHIADLLASLVPPSSIVSSSSVMRAASMRIAAGSFAGLIPLSTGLAAANALPKPVEAAVASTYGAAGIVVPGLASESSEAPVLVTHDHPTARSERGATPPDHQDLAWLVNRTTNDDHESEDPAASERPAVNPIGGGNSGGNDNPGGGNNGGNDNPGGGSNKPGGGNDKPAHGKGNEKPKTPNGKGNGNGK